MKPFKRYRSLCDCNKKKKSRKKRRQRRYRKLGKRRRKEERLSFPKPKIEMKEEDYLWDRFTYGGMGFDTDIYDGFEKMRAATLLGDIGCLHQRTKNLLKYVHTNSKYGILLQYQILTLRNPFQYLQDKKAGLTRFLSICQVERIKIRWP